MRHSTSQHVAIDFPVDVICKILFLDTLLQPNTKY